MESLQSLISWIKACKGSRIMPGDVVVGVENNLSGNIQVYKTLLQNAGAKVKVIINGKEN
jgi:hypothetical protein